MSSVKVDVIDLIDRHPVVGFQIGVLILCMLVAAIDGFDTQAIGYTAPAIAGVLKLPMAQFGQVGSAGLVGAAIGALSFGPLADLFGRKWFMILAIVVFAIFSFMTARSASLEQLLAYRFLAGLGPGRRDAGISRDGR
jgi:MFS transporter, AAHS family, 4-hydroxybenzoate transporter